MAKKKFDITAILMAAAGGAIANTAMNLATDKITMLQDKPALVPIIPATIGTMGIYFMDNKYAPAFYGMIGAAGGDVVDSLGLFNGLSRMNYEINGVEDLDRNPLLDWTENMKSAESELEDKEDYQDEIAELIELSSEE